MLDKNKEFDNTQDDNVEEIIEEIEYVYMPPPPPPHMMPPHMFPPHMMPPPHMQMPYSEEDEYAYVDEDGNEYEYEYVDENDDDEYEYEYVQEGSDEGNITENPAETQSPQNTQASNQPDEAIKFSNENAYNQPQVFRDRGFWIMKLFNIFITLAILSAIGVAIFFLVDYYRKTIIQRSELIATQIKQDFGEVEQNIWNLRSSAVYGMSRGFYEALGDVNEIISPKDILIKATLALDGIKKPMFYIRKNNGNTYLKIGIGADEKSYLLTSVGDGVLFLEDNNFYGKKELLRGKESLFILSLISFDYELYRRTFTIDTVDNLYNDGDMLYEAQVALDDKQYNSLSIKLGTNLKYQYYFNLETKLLDYLVISDAENSVKIEYLDYKGRDMKYPHKVKIYSDSKLDAVVEVDSYLREKGLMFPR